MNTAAAASSDRQCVLMIDGMVCAACAAAVEAVLRKLPGVRRATVNFAADAAVVEWQVGTTDVDALTEAVQRLGYRASLPGAVGTDGAEAEDRSVAVASLSRRLAVAVFFAMWTMLPAMGLYLEVSTDPVVRMGLAWACAIFSLPVFGYAGLPFYRMGVLTLRHGVAGIDAMLTLGVAGSVGLSLIGLWRGTAEVYFEVGVALVTFQLLARLVEQRIRGRARRAVTELLQLAPTRVEIVDDDGRPRMLRVDRVAVGDCMRVRPGDTFALDGRVLGGEGVVDRSLLTGESSGVAVRPGASVRAGERLLDGALDVAVSEALGQRRMDQLAQLVRGLLADKPPWQRWIDLSAQGFLIAAVLAALVGAGLALDAGQSAQSAGERALAVFVIACPCALSLAVPLPGLVAFGAAARTGVVFRDLAAVTHAARPTQVYFDKTGTLTHGEPSLEAVRVLVPDLTRANLLALAAEAEQGASHPLATAIRRAAGHQGGSDGTLTTTPGAGISWRGASGAVCVGSGGWLESQGVALPSLPATTATRVWVVRDSEVVGALEFRDTLRPDVHEAIEVLRDLGTEPAILSGDDDAAVREIADALALPAWGGMRPEDKVACIQNAQRCGEIVAFVGDGLNDAPALAAADLGIAVGDAMDSAKAAAAVVFARGGVTRLPDLLSLTGRTRRIALGNLIWAFAYNGVAVLAAVLGFVHPAAAALAMTGSALAIVLNACRAAKFGQG